MRGERRITIDEFVSVMAWHDDNHLDQLKRALEGVPDGVFLGGPRRGWAGRGGTMLVARK